MLSQAFLMEKIFFSLQVIVNSVVGDVTGPDQCNSANAIFCSWMAVGNILGFSAGASGDWHRYSLTKIFILLILLSDFH